MSVLTLPLRGGPNEAVSDHDLEPGELASALNVSYDPDGTYGTRPGYQRLGGSELQSMRRLAVSGSELVAVAQDTTNASRLFTYDPGSDDFLSRCRVPSVAASREPLLNTSANFYHWDQAICGDYLVVAWIEHTTSAATRAVRVVVLHKTTGAVVVAPTVLLGGSDFRIVRVMCSSTEAVVVWYELGTPAIWGARIALPGGSWGSPATIDTAVMGAAAMGAVAQTTDFILFYPTTTGTIRGRRLSFASVSSLATAVLTGSLSGTVTDIAACNINGTNLAVAVGSDGAGTTLAVWITNQSIATSVFMNTFGAPNGVNWGTVAIGWIPSTSTGVIIASKEIVLETNMDNQVTYYQRLNTVGPLGNVRTVHHVTTASDPFEVNGRALAIFRNCNLTGAGKVQQGSYHVVDLNVDDVTTVGLTPSYVATIAPRIANQEVPLQGTPPAHVVPVTLNGSFYTSWQVALPITRGAQGRQGLELVTMDSETALSWPVANLGTSLYAGTHYYDGRIVAESGFAWAPAIRDIVDAGSGSLPAGDYTYRVTYGRINNNGELEESAPSDPVTATIGASGLARLRVRTIGITSKMAVASATTVPTTPIYVIVYRTRIASSGDTLFYRVNKDPLASAYEVTPGGQYVTIDDNDLDATITDGTHPILYTDSGELRHVIPESAIDTCVHKSRVWWIFADGKTVGFTQEASDGLVPAYADLQSFILDDPGERLVGLEGLYDKLLLFSTNYVYVVFGDGPSIAGTGSDLTSPTRITAPGGCVDRRSIVQCPMGVAYRSSRGFELVGPDLSVVFLGEPISRSLASYPKTTSAVHCPNSSTIRWTVVDQETANQTALGRTFVYDYRRNRWSIYSLYIGGGRVDASYGAPNLAGTYHPTYGYVTGHYDTTAAYVSREKTTADANTWTDRTNVFIPVSLKLGWIKSAGDIGWQRVKQVGIEGTYYTPHKLTITLGYDYATPADAAVWNTSVNADMLLGSRELAFKRPVAGSARCAAVQFQVDVGQDVSNVIGNGRSVVLQSLALDIVPRTSMTKGSGSGAKQ